MTSFETIMLSVCFGAVVGTMIGNYIFIIKCSIDEHKEKKRKKALEQEQKNKA